MRIESTHNVQRAEVLRTRALNMTNDGLRELRSALARELARCNYRFSNQADYLARDIQTCNEILEERHAQT